jgi:hypothetical protein
VIEWLLDSGQSIRWQVMRDLLDAPKSQWRPSGRKSRPLGWGAREIILIDMPLWMHF